MKDGFCFEILVKHRRKAAQIYVWAVWLRSAQYGDFGFRSCFKSGCGADPLLAGKNKSDAGCLRTAALGDLPDALQKDLETV